MKTYWNHDGKHQEWVNSMSAKMPDMYDTDNTYMNVFIAFSKFYYDVYNNGSWNIKDGTLDNRIAIIKDYFGNRKFNVKQACSDMQYLENKANELFEKLMSEDMSFENHGFWNNWKERKVSRNKQEGENWHFLTCGTLDNVNKEFESRKGHGFKVV